MTTPRCPDASRRHRPVHAAAIGASMLAFEAAALACPICFQLDDAATTNGVRAAVLVLIGVTAAVLAGFAWFIVGCVRRAASIPLPPEHQPAGTVPAADSAATGPPATRWTDS